VYAFQYLKELINKRKTIMYRQIVTEQGGMVLNYNWRFKITVWEKIFTERVVRPWHCCPEKLCITHPCRHSKEGPWAA